MEVLNGITEGLFRRVQAARTRLAAVPDDADLGLVALRDEVLALLAEAEGTPMARRGDGIYQRGLFDLGGAPANDRFLVAPASSACSWICGRFS